MLGIRPCLAAVVLSVWACPALAVCPGANVLYEDGFDQFRPTWGDASPVARVDNGRMVIAPASGTYAWVVNNAGLYDDLDMCVTVTTLAGADPLDARAGIIFWYEDVNNFYVFEIAPNGKASVWRRQRGKWLAQVKWADAQAANKGDGAVNELRVTAVAGDATFYVNGSEFRKLAGSPPDKGQQVGLLVASPEQSVASFAFDLLRVTKP